MPRIERARRPPKAENRAHIPRAIASREAMLWQGCSLSPSELERKRRARFGATCVARVSSVRRPCGSHTPPPAAFVRQGQSPRGRRDARPRRKTERGSLSPRELERKAPRSVWATQLPASRPIRWIVRESREANRTDSHWESPRPHSIGRTSRRTPRVHGRTRPLFIGQTSLALTHVNRTDSHSESPRPLSHGRTRPH